MERFDVAVFLSRSLYVQRPPEAVLKYFENVGWVWDEARELPKTDSPGCSVRQILAAPEIQSCSSYRVILPTVLDFESM